jgi:hypothetical protein
LDPNILHWFLNNNRWNQNNIVRVPHQFSSLYNDYHTMHASFYTCTCSYRHPSSRARFLLWRPAHLSFLEFSTLPCTRGGRVIRWSPISPAKHTHHYCSCPADSSQLSSKQCTQSEPTTIFLPSASHFFGFKTAFYTLGKETVSKKSANIYHHHFFTHETFFHYHKMKPANTISRYIQRPRSLS